MINVILAGVGGQGLVLTTKILSDVAHLSGYDVKSNDVIGLSQRGGKVWGSVKFGEKVYSPNVNRGEGDFLLGFEPLEALRWHSYLKPEGKIFLNSSIVPPVPVIAEKESYPVEMIEQLSEAYKVKSLDANKEAVKLGSVKIANTFLLGMLAQELDIEESIWLKALELNVPSKSMEMNIKAFKFGFTFK